MPKTTSPRERRWLDKLVAAGRISRALSKQALRCELCSQITGNAAGWRAYPFERLDDGSQGIAFFCPGCAEREFGRIERHRLQPVSGPPA